MKWFCTLSSERLVFSQHLEARLPLKQAHKNNSSGTYAHGEGEMLRSNSALPLVIPYVQPLFSDSVLSWKTPFCEHFSILRMEVTVCLGCHMNSTTYTAQTDRWLIPNCRRGSILYIYQGESGLQGHIGVLKIVSGKWELTGHGGLRKWCNPLVWVL